MCTIHRWRMNTKDHLGLRFAIGENFKNSSTPKLEYNQMKNSKNYLTPLSLLEESLKHLKSNQLIKLQRVWLSDVETLLFIRNKPASVRNVTVFEYDGKILADLDTS